MFLLSPTTDKLHGIHEIGQISWRGDDKAALFNFWEPRMASF